MKISFGLDVKSIDKAVKSLEKAKKDLQGQVITDLLNGCCGWLIRRANEILSGADIGSNVKNGIINGWQTSISDNVAILTNTHDKAVYVEFGVGAVGEKSPHKNADEAGYEYNVESPAKSSDDTWHFYANRQDLDIPLESLKLGTHWFKQTEKDKRKRLYVVTAGAKGVMYAYNALVDLKDYGAKEVWEQVKQKYWG